jgi:hypothetical protein
MRGSFSGVGLEFGIDTHRACGSRDDLLRVLHIVGIEVLHLLLGDLGQLLLRELGDLVLRLGGTLLDTELLQDEAGCRWLLDDERERAVLIHREDDRDDIAHHGAGLRIELIDEFANVDAGWSERSTNRRSRSCGARLDLQFDDFGDFFCHIRI